jgi:hypothetical protein
MGAYLAIAVLYSSFDITTLVIVDNLDLVRVTCTKYETDSIFIVDPHAPLTDGISFEFLEPVAGRHFQERYLSSGID